MNEKPRVEEAIASYHIVKQLIELGYPHDFQHESKHVVNYCYQVADIIKQALAIKEFQELKNKEDDLKLKNDIEKNPLDLSIDEVGFSKRTRNVLFRGRLKTMRDVVWLYNTKRLFEIRFLGKRTYFEIENKLIELGMITERI